MGLSGLRFDSHLPAKQVCPLNARCIGSDVILPSLECGEIPTEDAKIESLDYYRDGYHGLSLVLTSRGAQ